MRAGGINSVGDVTSCYINIINLLPRVLSLTPWRESKGSVSQLMDDLDLIIEQVEVMVNSIQKGVENVLRKQCRLKTLLLL